MDPIKLLEDDHRKVKRLMAECARLDGDGTSGGRGDGDAAGQRTALFDEIRREMTVHEIIEEEIFYPALREHPRAKDEVLEGIQEHHVVDTLMGELVDTPAHDERWPAKFKVMQENVEHHIEEEEGTMFPTARKVFDKDELQDLGGRMERRKQEAMASASLPEPPSVSA
ncbi:MAG TPA: hemerythrin domain-containing protein [Candidatus Limnocylindrales bacterium]